MTLPYSISINGEEIIRIESGIPGRLPVPMRINRTWLRTLVAEAIRKYYRRKSVVKV